MITAEKWIFEEGVEALINSEKFAVRPNLNKRGVLTVHRTSSGGKPDYAHAHFHLDPYSFVTMKGSSFHVTLAAVRAIREGIRHKYPCASAVGTIIDITSQEVDVRRLEEVVFNPHINDHFVSPTDGSKVLLEEEDEVVLWAKRCWVRRHDDTACHLSLLK